MKRVRLVIWGATAVLAVLALGLFAATRLYTTDSTANADHFAYQHTNEDGGLSELWKAPSFSLPDQRGDTVSPSTLAGHVWIADFIFTTCQTQCPLLTAKMVLLQHKLTDPALRFVSFSVDPKHDTPAALLSYSKTWNEHETRWLLLHTEPDSLQALGSGMHVSVAPSNDAKSPILHTRLFFLVDPSGGVRGIYDSEDADGMARLKTDTLTLLKSAGASLATLPSSGAELFQAAGCQGCHENPALAPPLGGIFGSEVQLADKRQVKVDQQYLHDSITTPGAQVVAGYLNIMPAYENELTDAQVMALESYVRSLPATPSASAGSAVAAQAQAPAPSHPLPASPASSPAAIVTDPVCGMPVRAASTSPHLTQAGHEYCFCSTTCRDKFVANPTQYLSHHSKSM